MEVSKEHIIEKTRQLSELINSHPLTINYKNLHSELVNDKKSMELLSQLVLLGQETTEKINHGEDVSTEYSWEKAALQEELNGNDLVKKYILAQKDYLQLITTITDRIKNPQ